MKKSIIQNLLVLIGLMCISMTVFTLVVSASQVTASCADGSTVQCDGFNCSAQTNVGCTCRNERGVIVDRKKCPKIHSYDED